MPIQRLLVANRGEIAVRIMRAAAEQGIHTVAIHPADDEASLHTRMASQTRLLTGTGVMAYLDAEQVVQIALDAGCDAVHPGYGFLAENSEFARKCQEAGLTFVGPTPEQLEVFGDKVRARMLAAEVGVPVLAGTEAPTTLEDAASFMTAFSGAPVIIKALAGGGGRGMRVVRAAEELPDLLKRAQAEAKAAFGNGDVYLERLIQAPRHIEVQVVGDGRGGLVHLGERDCSIQRRHQKLVEIAPSPGLPEGLRDRITEAAVRLAAAVDYQNLGTFEFLVESRDLRDDSDFAFIEANPRLQVEHTVTEEVTGLDLVHLQLEIAGGASLTDLGLSQQSVPAPRGYAIQARVNMETMAEDGSVRPAGGTLSAFQSPSGRGIRTDSFGYSGYQTSPRFDSLLAKVIAYSRGDFRTAAARLYRALAEFRIEGVQTNLPFLQSILSHPAFLEASYSTEFIEAHLGDLVGTMAEHERVLFPVQAPPAVRRAGAQVDRTDPLAVLAHGAGGPTAASAGADDGAEASPADGPPGTIAVPSALQGTIVSLEVEVGAQVVAGRLLLVMEAMKMQHEVVALASGVIRGINVAVGDTIYPGQPLMFIEPAEVAATDSVAREEVDLDRIRPDLAEVDRRRGYTLDDARPDAIARRHGRGLRTARENIEDLCDPDTFVEYGGLAVPGGMGESIEHLAKRYPADGMITGIGAVNGQQFPAPDSRCVVMSYDYTVLAGTQGGLNHRKTDRLLEVAGEWGLPVVLFTEGGGGRAGGAGSSSASGFRVGGPLDVPTWRRLGALSGQVPLVGVNSGFSFAGNAALLGCCDVVIATANSSIGMGGPAMIEGGNLGVFRPDEVGPMSVQVPNGVVDIAVQDEVEAVEVAKRYLSYFQGSLSEWESADQRVLRNAVPENRLRVYDIRHVIETIADVGSYLELRPQFGKGMITALIRIEGRPVGVIANNPMHQSGAIESDGADKASRFMQLCDAFDLPILSLCDTPGIMVGPEAEKTALVRHSARMFVVGSNITVPLVSVILRKSYGLGAMTMMGATLKSTAYGVAWPTGEFGGMGLEGQVKLGNRAELAAIEDPEERRVRYDELVAAAYERGKALNAAVSFGIDDVIDPADTRSTVASIFGSLRWGNHRRTKKRRNVDTW